MRKLLALLILIALLFLASCDLSDAIYANLFSKSKGNPFIENVYKITSNSAGQLEFVVVADVHLGRERDNSGITRYDDNFEAFLKDHKTNTGSNYTALLSLGDLVDQQEPANEDVEAFVSRFSKYCSNRFITMVGNHDLHAVNSTQWENASLKLPDSSKITYYAKRMCVVKCGEVSIYITNNAKRLFGYQQLEYLEEALKKDTNPIKIVLAHENVMSGGELNQSLILYGNPDIYERSNFARIMEENGVALVLTAHTHRGNIIHKYKENTYEMNLCAYHARDTLLDLESKGIWYTMSFDTTSKEIVMKTYLASTKEEIAETRFSY